jgi:hypothetical protein
VPETQAFGEAALAALVPFMAAVHVEHGTAENISVPSQELPVNVEPEEPVTHEEVDKIPEVNNVPISVETEPEFLSTNSTSEDKAHEVEELERHVLSPENREAADMELKNDIISPTAAEPGPEVVAPVLGTFELQAQHYVEKTTEVPVSFTRIPSASSLVNCNKILKEVHIEAASEPEFVVPNEGRSQSAMEVLPTNSQLELIVQPVISQLEIPDAEERDTATKVEPQIIPAIVGESPAQIEEERPAEVRQLLSSLYLLTVKPQRTTQPYPNQSIQNLSTVNLFQRKSLLWSWNRNQMLCTWIRVSQ